jgi:hypothetical protein
MGLALLIAELISILAENGKILAHNLKKCVLNYKHLHLFINYEYITSKK